MNAYEKIKSQVLATFDQNIQKIDELRKFDEILLEHISGLVQGYRDKATIPTTKGRLDKLLTSILAIKTNGSLRENYQTINNQCLVLLVSHFGSTLGELFRRCFTYAMQIGKSGEFEKREIKATIDELRNLGTADEGRVLGDLYMRQNDISFQDMKSILSSFEDCFTAKMPRDERVNNIILVQACRHVIVHSGGIVDERLVKQVKSACPRKIKPEILVGDHIVFEKEEIDLAIHEMKEFIASMVSKLEIYFSNPD